MTFREKLRIEHPDCINDNYTGGCFGCPSGYEYEKSDKCSMVGHNCTKCWDREIPKKFEEDFVSHPTHYASGNVECIDAIRACLSKEGFEDFCRGNVLKYIWRYKRKGGVDDLRKARVYLNWMIESNEKQEE